MENAYISSKMNIVRLKNIIKKLPVREVTVFCIITVIFVISLLASAMIPQSAIKDKMLKSAEYLCEGKQFYTIIDDYYGSRVDRYADSILLGIAWQYDADHPLRSVMRSAYYHVDRQNENDSLMEAVRDGKNATQQYLRYWHGSIAVVRPLMLVMSVREIYILNGVILAALGVIFTIVLIRRKYAAFALGMLIGLIAVAACFVPFSLEYTWTFILMFIFSLIVLGMAGKDRDKQFRTAFLCFGMITCFFDFLTTETLTLTVPLLLLLRIEKDKKKSEKTWKVPVRMTVMWGLGYVLTWIMKWVIASIVLGENVMPYVSEHIAERIGGTKFIAAGPVRYLVESVVRNVMCLFPIGWGAAGVVIGIILIVLYIYIAYVYRVKGADKKQILMYVFIGCIPYIRYLVLHNHAYLHNFFTYRAQLATILAMVLILEELKVGEGLRHEKKSK